MKKITLTVMAFLWVASASAGQSLDLMKPDFRKVKTSLDPKHTPKVEAPDKVKAGEWFDVKVTIGVENVHPSMAEHHVQWIAIYKDDVEISRVYLHPVYSKPEVTFTIALDESSTLKIFEQPNHTAPWVTTKRIRVVK